MPEKLILKLNENPIHSEVKLQLSEWITPVPLTRVKSLTIKSGTEGPPTVELTMYAWDDCTEVVITRDQANAILCKEAERQLAFLSNDEVLALRHLRAGFIRNGWSNSPGAAGHAAFSALDKIVTLLDKREVPF